MAHQLKVERSKPCRLTPLLLEPGPSACEVRVRPLRYEPRQTCNNALRDTYFKGACLVKGAYLVKGGLAERILSCWKIACMIRFPEPPKLGPQELAKIS